MANIKVKFKEAYQDFGAYALLKNVTDKGVLIVDGTEVLNSIADLPTTNTVDGQEKAVIVQNGQVVTTSINNIGGGGGGTPAGSDTQIQYNNAGAFGADSGFTRTSTGVTNISSTFGDETLQYQITDNLLGSGKNAIASTFTVPLGSLTDFTFSDGGDISSQKTLSYPSVSANTYSRFSYNGYRATVTVGTNQGNLNITSQESSLTKITDLDGIGFYKTGFRTSGGSATIGDIDGGNNTKITIDDVTQLITVSNVPTYADDAAAATGGLTTGQLYKTTTLGTTSLNIVP